MATRNIGYLAIMQLVETIANHCAKNDGVIHDTDLDRYINNLRKRSECYKDASITDLYTAYGDDRHDMIERHQVDTRTPSEYWKLTEYAQKCINPSKWFK